MMRFIYQRTFVNTGIYLTEDLCQCWDLFTIEPKSGRKTTLELKSSVDDFLAAIYALHRVASPQVARA
jgi:hypothetical protein